MRSGVGHDDGPTILSFQQISRHRGIQCDGDPGRRRVSLGIRHRDRSPRFKEGPHGPHESKGGVGPHRCPRSIPRRGALARLDAPSSHLIFRESPDDAARRITREQLELPDLALSGPTVVSEVYTPKRFPGTAHHWDIEFLFRGQLAAADAPHPTAWKELAFVDLRRTSKSEIARSQQDVIESGSLRFGAG